MNIITKICSLACISVMLFGCATPVGKYEDEVFKVISKNKEYRDYWFSSLHEEKGFRENYSKLVMWLTRTDLRQSEREQGYKLFAEMVSYSFDDFAGYWDATVTHDGRTIYQNNTLFDMDRINLPSVTLNVNHGRLHTADENPYKAQFEEFGLSREQMRKGLPAIGPDGRNIELCSFLPVSNGPLFEVSNMDADKLIDRLGETPSMGITCKDTVDATYWKMRRSQFIDNYGTERSADYQFILP
jgi:hypothetical protein